ncbi:MAG: hypothetical protein L0Y71_00865 [Gemmataceae bacterium]|nr:hypothetical protein [Gemmataceae bacterium]
MMSEIAAKNGSDTLERPFPWRCPRCRKKTVHRVTIPYQCRRKHLNETLTVVVPALAVPQCAECGELVFDYVAEEQVNDAFRQP